MEEVMRHFEKNDKIIFAELVKMKLTRLTAQKDQRKYFKKLCREIIGQQLAGKAADAITKRFEQIFPNRKINPKSVLGLSEAGLRAVGMSWAKARAVRDLAMKVQSNEVNLKNLVQLNDEEVIRELSKVKGIGRWTAEMFLIFTLGREDVFSAGDLGLKRGFKRLYDVREKEMERKTKKWSPHRSYGCLVLWNAVE